MIHIYLYVEPKMWERLHYEITEQIAYFIQNFLDSTFISSISQSVSWPYHPLQNVVAVPIWKMQPHSSAWALRNLRHERIDRSTFKTDVMEEITNSDNPLYDKIRYNNNLTVTKPSLKR